MRSILRASRRMPLRGGWPRAVSAAPVRSSRSVQVLRRPSALGMGVSKLRYVILTPPIRVTANVRLTTPRPPAKSAFRRLPYRTVAPSGRSVYPAVQVSRLALRPKQLIREQVVWTYSIRVSLLLCLVDSEGTAQPLERPVTGFARKITVIG